MFGWNKGVNDANTGQKSAPQGANESSVAFEKRNAGHAAQTKKNNENK